MLVPLLLAAMAGDPCAPPSAEPTDPVTAEAYLRVADQEEQQHHRAAAALAYAQALRFEPSNPLALAGHARTCRAIELPEDALDRALAKMEAKDHRGALELLGQLRALGPDLAAALLEGICWYELDDPDRARLLLVEAKAEPALAASANLYLGLIALRRGDTARARLAFNAAAVADPALEPGAVELARLSAHEGRLVIGGAVGVSYDSNVDLTPGTSAFPTGSGDGEGSASLSLLARPWGSSGPYGSVQGGYRKQLRLTRFDTGLAQGTVGWQLGDVGARGALEYRFDLTTFAATPYLVAHSFSGRAVIPVSRLQLAAEYDGRLETFLTAEAAGYSGSRHSARISVGWIFEGGSACELAYFLSRNLTSKMEFSHAEHGPEARVHLALGLHLRLNLRAQLRHREFDGIDPDFGVARIEDHLIGELRSELELTRQLTLFVEVEGRHVFASVPALSYTKLTGTLGLALSMGVL